MNPKFTLKPLAMNGGLGGDVLNTQQTYVTTIRADYYASSALKIYFPPGAIKNSKKVGISP